VNTAAVHALSYPLGGRFHIPHGVANAVLLPSVLHFNLPAAPERYAEVAVALIALRAIGYDEATDWIGGRIDRAAAMERTSLRTIQFAKRQRTWFRNRGRALPVPATEAVTEIVQAIRSA
jgi:alcohol dehydrogenase class IV